MSEAKRRTGFVRDCFRAVLNDGEPHRYREILEYARQQAQGTEFEGEIEPNNIVLAFNALIGNADSEYERVRHGIYQKRTPESVMQSTSVIEGDTLYDILDAACDLHTKMKSAFARLSEKLPEAIDLIQPDSQFALEHLDQSIDGISGWIAHMEDIADGEELTESEAPTMQM